MTLRKAMNRRIAKRRSAVLRDRYERSLYITEAEFLASMSTDGERNQEAERAFLDELGRQAVAIFSAEHKEER